MKTITQISWALIPLACIGLLSTAVAQLSPAPDGGYPNFNTAEGDFALYSLTTGIKNTALGFDALRSNTDGSGNTATGHVALYGNTIGTVNTATGAFALETNATGNSNTATGFQALVSNTTGNRSTATGADALATNTTGDENTANGVNTLYSNTVGFQNTASGTGALYNNITAFSNTADGVVALYNNTTGSNNTATGVNALFNNTSGSNNVALGINAGENLTTGDNNIDVGNQGIAAEAKTIRIGTQGTQTNTYIAGISGTAIAKGVGVVVDATGHLGTKPSSVRFKEAVKPMDDTSEVIHALRPVTFRYKKELDPDGTVQFGLLAENVEKVNPDLVVYDANGKPYTVRYDAVNAMLLNEFLKEHRRVQELEKQVKAITAGLQKVGFEVSGVDPKPNHRGHGFHRARRETAASSFSLCSR